MRPLQRTLMLACVAALATGCEVPTSTQLDVDVQLARGGGNGVVASATGSGVRTGSIRHFQFSALLKADGSVRGQFNLTFEGSDNADLHGEILCMRVDGNQAWIGNRTTRARFNPAFVGGEGGFYVEDNGEGAGASADRLSLTFVGQGPGFAQNLCDGGTNIENGAVEEP